MPLGIARLNTLGRIVSAAAPPPPTRTPVTLTAISSAKISAAQSKIGTSSMLLTASSGDVVRATNVPVSTTFTYELWVRFNSLPGSFHMFIGSEGAANETYFGLYNNGGTYQYTSVIAAVDRRFTPAALATNTWIHLALIKDGATWKLYENGVETTVASTSGSVPTASGMFHTTMRIGSYYNNSLHFDGYMDEIRYSDIVRYTTNFTPSTTAYTNDANTLMLIHAEGYTGYTTFVDDGGQTITIPNRPAVTLTAGGNAQISTAQSKIGSSSAVFDGSGDYIELTNLVVSNVFTYELWVRFISLPSSGNFQMLVGNPNSGSYYYGVYNNGGTLEYTCVINGQDRRFTPQALTTNTWIHLALVQDGTTGKLYENGVLLTASGASLPTNVSLFSSTMRLGIYTNGGLAFNGYMDEIRYSGTVRYTTNFTPSTSAFTNDGNTLMLLHFEDTNTSTDFIDDIGVAAPTLRADSYSTYLKLAVPFDKYYGVKDVAYIIKGSGSTSTRTQGASSTMSALDRYWTTNPDYEQSLLNSRNDTALTYNIDGNIPSSASGTFVVEGWFKPTDNNTNQNWVLSSADNNGRWLFGFNTGGSMGFGSENNIGFGSSTWQHVAIVCDGGTKRFYLNGVYKGAWVSSNTGFTTLHLGQFQAGDPNDYRGYIQDFRVYVGTNKGYTGTNSSSANFTLPSSIIESY